MEWIEDFDLFLLDFDGLLVNTEKIHFEAFKTFLSRHGAELTWDFSTYCLFAHQGARTLQDQVYKEFPFLKEKYPKWEPFYQEKKDLYQEILPKSTLELMPGVTEFLTELETQNKSFCVVTHSAYEHVEVCIKKLPVLEKIQVWFCLGRDYHKRKPDPEGFSKAIEHFGGAKQHIIGFDDAPRGVGSLQNTPAVRVLVNDVQKGIELPFKEDPLFVFAPTLYDLRKESFPVL